MLVYLAALVGFLLGKEAFSGGAAFARYLFIWVALAGVALAYVLSLLFRTYERSRRRQEVFLRLLLLSLSHRFGNFLAGQKVRLALLEKDPEAVRALGEGIAAMEEELRRVLAVLRYFLEERLLPAGESPGGILRRLVREVETHFGPRRLILRTGKAPDFLRTLEGELLVFFLLENAFRHGGQKIYLRAGRFRGRAYLALGNDLRSSSSPGSGLGLYLSRRLAEHLGLRLRIESHRNRFWALLSD